jgi:phosphate starvation-inducible PhoH-like protein
MPTNRNPKNLELTKQIEIEKQRKRGPIKFQIQLNEEQKLAKEKILNNAITILSGKAGSGKTLVACQAALDMLFRKEVRQIIVTRPTVSKEEIGFLPGDLREKMEPWMQPIYSNFYQLYNRDKIDEILTSGQVEIVPLAFMRGRAQPLHSKILTPTGWVEMGSLGVGDEIFGRDGEIYNINGIFPQGIEKVYTITFSDGTSTLASGNHLWEAYDMSKKGKSVIVNTDFIRENIKTTNGKQHRFKIPLNSPIKFSEKPLPIQPYALGALLGDGCFTQPTRLLFSSKDIELVENIKDMLPEGLELKKLSGENCDYGISKTIRNSHIKNNWIVALDELGLLGKGSYDKFIPEDYLYGSVEQRLELLRGLMDTDGSIFSGHPKRRSTSTVANFYTISENLRDGIIHLVQSLGGTASYRIRGCAGTTDKFGRSYNYDLFDIKIRMPPALNPFKLSRKAERFEVRETPVRIIRSVELYSEEETQCISVSAPDSLYITDNFIVTHNTFLDSFVIVDEAQNCTNEQMEMIVSRLGIGSKMVVCGDTQQVDLKHKQESGFKFLLSISKRIKQVDSMALLTNHRHPVVDALLDEYLNLNK